MRVSVLGPLEVEEGNRDITPSAGKPRQLVALLALHAGEVVPLRGIVEELWGARPPGNPVQSVQTYVLNLRRTVDAAGGSWARARLTTRHTGYQLDLGPDELDVRRYERLAGAGRWALDQGDPERASVLLASALDVWRGPALVDVPVGGLLAGKARRLDESRLGVLEARIDADLRLGRHGRVLGELSELNARYPMHEAVCAQYMTALYRSGRKWQALEAFRALRGALVDELGLEPSRRVRRVHQAILNSDPALDAFDERAATA
ncbi:AfsR/SARP family transcriptional regulator [Saccharothrix lopnurensis]|uniref:BTAD domain-containing putative transcriptional regulator n=1 Tax=Saccharothrix lopnurensis TaxID=1670621 RepID=A0ABW1PJ12_9PSEU